MGTRLISLRKAAGKIGRRMPITGRVLEARRVRTRRQLLLAMPPMSVCAEIGVWRGTFSESILAILAPRTLHLIDPWAFQPQSPGKWEGGSRATSQADMDAVYEQVVEKFKDRHNVVIHRVPSSNATHLFPNDYFDWIYIDGNHDYDYVRADLEGYLPLVRRLGYLTGDDYYWAPDLGLPVKRAVDEVVGQGVVELVSVRGSQFILRKL